MSLFLLPLALAGPVPPVFGLSLGAEAVTNDPFLLRDGVRAGATLRVAGWVEVGVNGEWFPVLAGDGNACAPDWTEQACALVLKYQVSPDFSRIVGEGEAVVRVRAADIALDEHWRAVIGLEVGLGAVATEDDTTVLGDDEYDTASQVHPAARGALFAEAGTRRVSVRVHYGMLSYVETISGTVLEMKQNAMLGADVILWFP